MSAADRMAVRMPGGRIRSVPRRVGLAMVARSQATHAPAQGAPRPGAKGQRPASAVTVVTAEAPELTAPVHPLSQTPGQIAETMRTGELPGGPAHSPDLGASEGTEDVPCTCPDDDPTALPVEAPAVERPRGNAARKVWAEFARVHGVEVTGYMTRDQIRDAVDAQFESDRMSRPAHEGGRPATPEDEPVTEDMVTSADPGERTA
jgi:hypothetical protein